MKSTGLPPSSVSLITGNSSCVSVYEKNEYAY
jgi:hypothetical protein